MPLTESEARNLAASQDGVVHVSNNGIYNDLDAAAQYAQQHGGTLNADGSKNYSDKPVDQYVIVAPESNNIISELMVAGYTKTGLSTTLGLTNVEARTAQVMQDAAAQGKVLEIDSHSRGTMTTQNAVDYLNKNGGLGTGQPASINLFNYGAAASDASTAAALQQLTGNPNAKVNGIVHPNDLIGADVGGNVATPSYTSTDADGSVISITAKDDNRSTVGNFLNILLGTATPHNCYGTSGGVEGCGKQWNNIPESNALPIKPDPNYKAPLQIPQYGAYDSSSNLLKNNVTQQSNQQTNQLLNAVGTQSKSPATSAESLVQRLEVMKSGN